jgi:hypothetical protein
MSVRRTKFEHPSYEDPAMGSTTQYFLVRGSAKMLTFKIRNLTSTGTFRGCIGDLVSVIFPRATDLFDFATPRVNLRINLATVKKWLHLRIKSSNSIKLATRIQKSILRVKI